LKALILVPSFGHSSPVVGAFLFAKYLDQRGVDVVFASLDNSYNMGISILDQIKDSGVEHYCLGIKGWGGIIQNSGKLQKFCRANQITVVMAYLLRPTILTSRLKGGVIKIASVRGMLNQDYAITYGKGLSKVLLTMEMRGLRKMHSVLAMNDAMKTWLISEGIKSDRISIFNNFIDVRRINSAVLNSQQRSDNKFHIGMFCKLIQRKRIDIALSSISKLVYDYYQRDIVLHIVGTGPLRKSLERLASELYISDFIVFTDFSEDPFPKMSEMDLILLTSDSEGVPRCLMEALSMGKTTISSDIQGVRDLIIDGKTGYLFKSGDSEALAALINKVITEKAYLPYLELVDFMYANYDVDSVCSKMLAHIESTC